MPRSQRQSSVELDEDIWDYPPNGLVGKKIKLNCFDTIKYERPVSHERHPY